MAAAIEFDSQSDWDEEFWTELIQYGKIRRPRVFRDRADPIVAYSYEKGLGQWESNIWNNNHSSCCY